MCCYGYRLARTGFEELDTGPVTSDANDSWSSGTPRQTMSYMDDARIPLCSGLLVELLSGIYYAMLVVLFYCLFCHAAYAVIISFLHLAGHLSVTVYHTCHSG